MNLGSFRDTLLEHDNIFVDSAMFRNEFTYFVNYQILRMPEEYASDFIKPPFHVDAGRISHRDTLVSQFTLMDDYRDCRDTYQKDVAPRDIMTGASAMA